MVEDQGMVFILGTLYIVSGLTMFVNRNIPRSIALMLCACFVGVGTLNYLFLVFPFPHEFLWFSRILMLGTLILSNLIGRKNK